MAQNTTSTTSIQLNSIRSTKIIFAARCTTVETQLILPDKHPIEVNDETINKCVFQSHACACVFYVRVR